MTRVRHRPEAVLPEVFRRLLARHGPQRWWPGETPFEVAVGAVLTQNTAWTNVEKAIATLKGAGALDPGSILALSHERLAAMLRPAGYFNVKARRLASLVRFLVDEAGGDPTRLATGDLARTRQRLLEVPGVGRETADSILLYAAGRPIFVVDAYTRRVFGRIGVVDPLADYDEIRAAFEGVLPPDAAMFNEYHALIVAHGKGTCRKRPRCGECELVDLCRRVGFVESAT
jgi:endonuclease-3 related protein